MKIKEIVSKCDHTLLKQTATWADIKALCDDGMKYGVASVCIPACYVRQATEYVYERLPICTVIGFPNGYDSTHSKCVQALDAINDGADEIDMVINIGWVKDREWGKIVGEIREIKRLCGKHVLKVIVETCLLTDEEKLEVCRCVTDAGADYIKTSTGFSTAGATQEDVILMRANVGPNVKVKAAGGINNLDDAKLFIENGADRLGTSKVIKIVKESKWDMEAEI